MKNNRPKGRMTIMTKHLILGVALTLRLMMRTALVFIPILLIFASAGAENSTAQQLPFHAVFQGNSHPFSIDQCTLNNQESGSGVALHLGAWTWSDNETVRFLSCPPPGTAIAVSGRFKMVAANGDEIQGTVETTGTLDPVAGVSVHGSYTFVSGTGRFAHVSGTGVIAVDGSAAPPFDFVTSMDGTISKVGVGAASADPTLNGIGGDSIMLDRKTTQCLPNGSHCHSGSDCCSGLCSGTRFMRNGGPQTCF